MNYKVIGSPERKEQKKANPNSQGGFAGTSKAQTSAQGSRQKIQSIGSAGK